jgi:hypothetical protein
MIKAVNYYMVRVFGRAQSESNTRPYENHLTTIVVHLCHLDRAGGDPVGFSANVAATGRECSSRSGPEAVDSEETGPTHPVS